MSIPQRIAENMGQAKMAERLYDQSDKKGQTLWETLLLQKGKGRLRGLYRLLTFLGIPYISPSYAHRIKAAFQKGADYGLKEILTDIKLEHAAEEIFLEKVEHGQKYGVIAAFEGHTAGAVRDFEYVNYAYIAENLPIRGVYLDRKEILTHLMPKFHSGYRDNPGATYRQLTEAYNAYYDQYYGSDSEAPNKIRALKKELGLYWDSTEIDEETGDPKEQAKFDKSRYADVAVEDIEVSTWDYVYFGFQLGQSKRIDTSNKAELNFRELHDLNWWLIRNSGRDQVADHLKKTDAEAYEKMFTYGPNHHAIANSQDMRDVWVQATGFTKELQYMNRELTQKAIMFALKGASTLVNAVTRQRTFIGQDFKNDWDYYNRSLGRMQGIYMRQQLREQEDDPKGMIQSVNRTLELLDKKEKGEITPEEGEALEQQSQRLQDYFEQGQDRLGIELDEDEIRYVRETAHEYAQKMKTQNHWDDEKTAKREKEIAKALSYWTLKGKQKTGKISRDEIDRLFEEEIEVEQE